MAAGRMALLTTVHGSFHAQVLAARLGADGVVTELRGAIGGPYPLFGEVQVLVPEDDLTTARDLLLADEVEDAFAAGRRSPSPAAHPAIHTWIALAALAAVAMSWLARGL